MYQKIVFLIAKEHQERDKTSDKTWSTIVRISQATWQRQGQCSQCLTTSITTWSTMVIWWGRWTLEVFYILSPNFNSHCNSKPIPVQSIISRTTRIANSNLRRKVTASPQGSHNRCTHNSNSWQSLPCSSSSTNTTKEPKWKGRLTSRTTT